MRRKKFDEFGIQANKTSSFLFEKRNNSNNKNKFVTGDLERSKLLNRRDSTPKFESKNDMRLKTLEPFNATGMSRISLPSESSH